jgi:hypothetical protein
VYAMAAALQGADTLLLLCGCCCLQGLQQLGCGGPSDQVRRRGGATLLQQAAEP